MRDFIEHGWGIRGQVVGRIGHYCISVCSHSYASIRTPFS